MDESPSSIPERPEHFLPIEDYGVIGNLHTAGLVSKQDASIDYLCFPEFDSPLLFGRLLTRHGGGHFQISPSASPMTTAVDGASTPSKWSSKQMYLPSSNILVTRFLGSGHPTGSATIGGIGQVTDFLPVSNAPRHNEGEGPLKDLLQMRMANTCQTDGRLRCGSLSNFVDTHEEVPQRATALPWVVRKVETIRGKMDFCVQCQPAFDYGRIGHTATIQGDRVIFHSEMMDLELIAVRCNLKDSALFCVPVNWRIINETVAYNEEWKVEQPKAIASFSLSDRECIYFVLRRLDPNDDEEMPTAQSLRILLHETDTFWHDWISKCTYKGRWRELIHRSALVLKLLTFAPTGAIIAALTTSLPEAIGGSKNWDYRFTWIRDAAFTVYAFLRIGFKEEAADFMTWIEKRCREMDVKDPVGLRLMYDIRGHHPTTTLYSPFTTHTGTATSTTSTGSKPSSQPQSVLATEIELTHWTGYRDCRPVRIGNLAAFQQQLDIFGELMDAIYLCDKWVRPISYDFWMILRDRIIPPVHERWNQPDHGIWEVRDEPQHHVYSKVMAWVAMDRAIRLSQKRSLPAPLGEWLACRDAIYNSIMEHGYNPDLGVFIQHYGADVLDASNLIMPLVFFIQPDDPRFLRTLEATLLPPRLGGLTVNNLVFRFHPGDEHKDPEGTFTMCSFWLVEALARAGARNPHLLNEARLLFDDVIGYANHLGLFSEEIGLDGNALGNFPQAFTHLSLISAAFNLDRALG